uniref:WW domain-containing protein n=1 Tax=Alexandrium monilatum TaxID=311494 RepID=A0A6T1E6K8_9DINO
MINAAAALGGGILLKQKFDDLGQDINKLGLPKLRRKTGKNGDSFRLSVRVVAASIPALPKPGYWSRQRPRLEVALDKVKKETELADYSEGSAAEGGGACACECPWRFGDTLTFIVNLKDVLGPGFKLRLTAISDVFLGPVQLQLSQVAEVGEARVDLRTRALPGCVPARRRPGRAESWDSPVLLIPLAHVRGGLVCQDQELGNAVAHVALAFSADADPDCIIEAAEAETRSVADVLQGHADSMKRWLQKPMELGRVLRSPGRQSDASPRDSEVSQVRTPSSPSTCDALRTLSPRGCERAACRANSRNGNIPVLEGPLLDPEQSPDGWISRKGRDGRVFWHHRQLGPAPWEEAL